MIEEIGDEVGTGRIERESDVDWEFVKEIEGRRCLKGDKLDMVDKRDK
jgi:hypothetical protein